MISTYTCSPGPGQSGSNSSRSVVGYSPPCSQYASLETLASFGVLAEEFKDATCSDDLKQTLGKINALRKPMKELNTALVDAVRVLKKVRDDVVSPPRARGKARRAPAHNGCRLLLPRLCLVVIFWNKHPHWAARFLSCSSMTLPKTTHI